MCLVETGRITEQTEIWKRDPSLCIDHTGQRLRYLFWLSRANETGGTTLRAA